MKLTPLHFLAATVIFAGSAAATHVLRSGDGDAGPPAPIRITSFHETYSSVTPADWATSADHIAEVTVTGESRGMQEGTAVERIVQVRVDRTRWSRPGAELLPGSFDMTAYGWVETEQGLAEMTVPDAPRIEPGHRYLMGLILLEPRCNPDDGLVVRGGWNVIGSGGTIPFDGGDVGLGEIEGMGDESVDGVPGSMLAAAETASDASSIVELVDEAEPGRRPRQPGVRDGC